MIDLPTVEQLVELVAQLSGLVEELRVENAGLLAANAELVAVHAAQADQIAAQAVHAAVQAEQVAAQADRIAVLERQVSRDSSNSSKPGSGDASWDKKPAKKRSSRSRSGRKPGKQSGSSSVSRRLSDDPDRTIVRLEPGRCHGCSGSLSGAAEVGRQRRQVVDIAPAPAPEIIEYQRVSRACGCCGTVTAADWADAGEHAAVLASAGSPVRIGPATLARAALLTCGHYLPIGRTRELFTALCGIDVSTGFLAGVRGRAARILEKTFTAHMRALLGSAPVLHADETTGRAAGTCKYVHVACTEYLTLMHVGGRSKADIDAGGVLPSFTGVLVRDGYAGYAHLPRRTCVVRSTFGA